MYPEQVSACSDFLLLLFNRLILLVEQLMCTFRRLAGNILHRHALPEIGPVIRCGEVRGSPDSPRTCSTQTRLHILNWKTTISYDIVNW